MGSIDRNDQMRMHGGGFSAKGHLAIFDTMLLNTLFALNASALEVTHRKRLLLRDEMKFLGSHSYQQIGTAEINDVHACIHLGGPTYVRMPTQGQKKDSKFQSYR